MEVSRQATQKVKICRTLHHIQYCSVCRDKLNTAVKDLTNYKTEGSAVIFIRLIYLNLINANRVSTAALLKFARGLESSLHSPRILNLLKSIENKYRSQITSYEFKEENNSKNTADCAVCLEYFENADSILQTGCKHEFHEACLKEWLNDNGTCPMCRRNIRPDQFVWCTAS